MYNHNRQYRCTIIRGKSKSEMDDLLAAYAQTIDDICPCQKEFFDVNFNTALARYIPNGTKKTLDNHRTEIVGKLFGMYYLDEDGLVYTSERTKKFLEDNDQPAFFKDVCFKMQFPNGMDKSSTIMGRIENKISIRQNSFLLKTLLYAKQVGIVLTKNDVGYYILNSLDVLQGKSNPMEIIEEIENDRKNRITRKVNYPGKASSYNMQHINEQINYLELANLVFTNNEHEVEINVNELNTIEYFASFWNEKPEFDVYTYDLSTIEGRKSVSFQWDLYFSKISKNTEKFVTTPESLGIPSNKLPSKGRTDLIALGDEGEAYVLSYEKERVRLFDTRLTGKVVHLGKTKGLGYDIQSVIAETGDMSEFVKYIEVKSTKRVTAPDIEDSTWVDTVNLTRNEWVAAKQHGNFYSIYRVYFVRGNVIMYIIKNVYEKSEKGLLKVTPIAYRADFGNLAVDWVIKEER